MDIESSGMPRSFVIGGFLLAIIMIASRYNRILQFIVRGCIYLTGILVFSAYGTLIAILFTILGRGEEINWATGRAYVNLTAPLVGISLNVENDEYMQTRPAIFVCNHQAGIDTFVMGKVFPKHCVVVGKSSLRMVPLLGMFMTLGGAIFLDRSNHDNAMRKFADAVRTIKEYKVSVFIFPEGTRGHLQEADLLPFKKGAFHLAVQAEIPIVPIVVSNYSHIYDSRRQIFAGGEITIRVLPPISTEGIDTGDKEQIDELTNRTRQVMLTALKEISA
jgi:lysophosphatidate acyltransferase